MTFFSSLAVTLAAGIALSAGAQSPEAQPPVAPQRPAPQPATETTPARPPYAVQDQQKPVEASPVRPAPTQNTAPVPSREAFSYGTVLPQDGRFGSTYISLDSWIYNGMTRLYSLGYLDKTFLSMRPWTRRAALHRLMDDEIAIISDGDEEAVETFYALKKALQPEVDSHGVVYGMETAYARMDVNGGPVLRDSFHLGQSYVNDYGRPYGEGFNTYDGVSALGEYGRFSIHVRAEYQHAAGAQGYSHDLANLLSTNDQIPYTGYNVPQDTIPEGYRNSRNYFRLIDAYASVHLLNHEISFGKMDNWLGPNRGGALAWSNNADNTYAFRINRVEPLHVPLLSYLLGPLRYDFSVGPLQGHTYPNSPWMHNFIFSFMPTPNFEFAFQREVIWGGKDHAPITLHTFLKSFFSLDDTNQETKFSRNDPGARFSDFSFAYRLPFLRRWATLTLDSFSHDDATPISAPRRAAFRTGLYLPQLPKFHNVEARFEAALTDPSVSPSYGGRFLYFETVQRQGPTNKGMLIGDWMGREGKGGNAWITYHFSPQEYVEVGYLRKKNAKDFIPYGTTQNDYTVSVVKKLRENVDLAASLTVEQWTAPIYKPGTQTLTTGKMQVTWYPGLRNLK